MQSGQGFAFGKTLVTRHLARLRFTQSRLILNQPSQDAKAGLIYKKSHRVRGAAAPRKRSNPFFAAACTPQKTLCAGLGPKEPASADPTVDVRQAECRRPAFGGTRHKTQRIPSHKKGRGTAPSLFMRYQSLSSLRTAMNASVGTCTVPRLRIFFLPSFCFSSSFFLREMSPP